MTLLSRVLGFVRDIVIARVFGADAGTDAFFVAFKIPNFFRRLFAEGAFSQAFVPVFAEYQKHRSHAELRDLLSHVFGSLGSVALSVSSLGVIAAPLFVLLFAPGFIDDPQRYELASRMLRLTFPYLFCISLVAMAAGVLNSKQRFAIPAFTPVWLNLCLIGAAVFIAPKLNLPIMALAWGVLIAGVVQLLFQLPFLHRLDLLPKPRWNWRHAGVQKIIQLMLPAILGSAVVQVNLLFDTILASLLIVGSVSWLYFADRLVEFPLGVFGIAIATVILPSLSQRHAAQDATAFSRNMDWALRITLLVSVPAMCGLLLLAAPLMISLFQYGQFSAYDAKMSAYGLMAYALGLPAFSAIKILAPGFFARQDTRTPVKIAIRAVILNMLLNVIFVSSLWLLNVPAMHIGLALATALAAWAQAGWLLRRLLQENAYQPAVGWQRFLLQISGATLVMGAALWVFGPNMDVWLAATLLERVCWLMLLIGGGALSYFAVLWLSGVRLRQFRAVF